MGTDFGNIPGRMSTILDQYISKGLSRVNFVNADKGGVSVYATDLHQWQTSVIGLGGSASWTTHGKTGGWIRGTTTAAPSTAVQMLFGNVGIYDVATPAWYHAVRFQAPVALDANCWVMTGIQDSGTTCSISVGAGGAAHATDFFLHKDGIFSGPGASSGISLGVARDTAAHIAELWCQSGDNTVYACLDGGTIVSALQSSPPSGKVMTPYGYAANNGSTSVAHNLDIDWFVTLAQRT